MKTILASFIIALVLFTGELMAQVTIAPTNLFITSQNKFGTYMVINGSNETQEISINFFFGYSETDEEGTRSLINEDPEAEKVHSISDAIRAFPQNFVLTPGQRQVVRLRISAPNDLPDGTYWARIRTTSSPQAPPVEIQQTDVVSASVGINLEQVTGVFYKNGTVNTGIGITDIKPVPSEDNSKLVVLTSYTRTGNSPFLGSITTSLLNSRGEEVRRAFVSTTLFFDGIQRQEFELDGLAPGNYTVQVSFETQRADVSSSDLVQMEPVKQTVSYTIR